MRVGLRIKRHRFRDLFSTIDNRMHSKDLSGNGKVQVDGSMACDGKSYCSVPEWRNGRRGGLKNLCGNTCEFESRFGHHFHNGW